MSVVCQSSENNVATSRCQRSIESVSHGTRGQVALTPLKASSRPGEMILRLPTRGERCCVCNILLRFKGVDTSLGFRRLNMLATLFKEKLRADALRLKPFVL